MPARNTIPETMEGKNDYICETYLKLFNPASPSWGFFRPKPNRSSGKFSGAVFGVIPYIGVMLVMADSAFGG